MKLKFEDYNPSWSTDFEAIKIALLDTIGAVDPVIEHIGSTAVEGLSAKPIIDILIGVRDEEALEKIIVPLVNNGYVYYPIYNSMMPYRRFFVKHRVSPEHLSIAPIISEEVQIPKSTEEHNHRLAHIHILPYNSEHWIRHIAFRDYLRVHPVVTAQYQALKAQLSRQEWSDGNEYNASKNEFIKTEEQHAIDWYKEQQHL
ncbi:GrpB family protein [Sphingobacterium sp. SYP-B4668]|uniref:GrpB family protein n=1 Tax=Sphingobacterium sp. SYP-B4668 TaxID=2996035 RepID=UPI0022DE2287|nr:GrpB family protein [Sphingobacterium sp. SYP-B4668]